MKWAILAVIAVLLAAWLYSLSERKEVLDQCKPTNLYAVRGKVARVYDCSDEAKSMMEARKL